MIVVYFRNYLETPKIAFPNMFTSFLIALYRPNSHCLKVADFAYSVNCL